VLVVVVSVCGVAVTVVHVVDVIIVRHRDMAAILAVFVVVPVVGGVFGLLALVVMPVVAAVQVAVVHVVNVIAMRDGNVTAAFAVHMVVADMLDVSDCCRRPLPSVSRHALPPLGIVWRGGQIQYR
jgi:hypothetical protein